MAEPRPARPEEGRGWDVAAWGLILVQTLFLLSWWPLLPWFVDAFYHLNVVQGFREAGGIVLWDAWEFGPAGRPHLYPPALHVALLLLDGLRASPVTVARIACLITYPALLAATWSAARALLGRAAAWWTTVASLLSFSYLLVACNSLAASWALIFWLASLVAAVRGAGLACLLSGTLVWYTHLGTPWLLLLSWAVLAWGYPPARRVLAVGAAGSLVLASPWLWHLGNHRAAIHALSTMENELLELPLMLYALAAAGGVIAWRDPRRHIRWVVAALAIGMLPLLRHHAFRFWSGQGLLAALLPAGLALTWLSQRLAGARAVHDPRRMRLISGGLVIGLLAVNPVVLHSPQGARVAFADTAPGDLLRPQRVAERSNAVTFYYPRLMDPLVEVIRTHSGPDELLGCTMPHVGGLLAALSGRSMATGMLAEVRAAAPPGRPLDRARLIIWVKDPDRPGEGPVIRAHALTQGWQPVAETELAYVFRNPRGATRRPPPVPAAPLWAGQLLVGLAVLGIGWDLRRTSRVTV